MKLPVVAIVGRPNVGKSTLFNRIIGRREAIVDDRPGVTRDRLHAEADWAGRSFLLVDTGGYLPEREDQIARAVFEQVQGAIREADLVVFLVDAQTGVTAMDEELAAELKRSGANVLLAVNKVDSAAKELSVADFYRLGLGEPVALSAQTSRKVGDFLDELVARLPQQSATPEREDAALALAVVGRPNVGKSSFVNAIVGEDKMIVTEIPGTTRDAVDTRIKHFGDEIVLIDTAGLRKRSRVKDAIEYYSTVRSLASIRRCDVALVLIDATRGIESQDLRIIEEAVRLNKGVVLAVNKWDLIEKDSRTAREFEQRMREALKNKAYIPILFISARTKQRVYKVLDVVKSVYRERKKTIKTSELNDFLKTVTERYAPPSMDRREVKIKYCTQVRSNPPVIAFFTNAPRSIRANYRAYLENQFRERFGFMGVPLTLVFRRK